MTAKIYTDQDADLAPLAGKIVAVLGYGSQGRAQTLNLRDSGCQTIVAQRTGSENHRLAIEDGFRPVSVAEATQQADIIAVLLPDQRQPEIFRDEIRGHLSPGNALVFAHGFGVRFAELDVPEGVLSLLVAPLGPGSLVRSAYADGTGVPCLVAVGDDSPADAMQLALAYAKAIGGTRLGAIETTFAEETETDLFAEQAVLCGGLTGLIKAGFDTLVEAGYQPEIAYACCVREVKQIVDLIDRGGIESMRRCISDTAEYGDRTRGPRVVGTESRAEMRRILAEIQDGRFAREWLAESRSGQSLLKNLRQQEQDSPIETVGRRTRELLS